MEGSFDPTIDMHRVMDRIMSTAAILFKTSYAAVITMRNGEPNGAHVFELSRIARSFGGSRRSNYRYILQTMPRGRVMIYEVLQRHTARCSIRVGGEDSYTDSKIHIAAFSEKQHALDWCASQYFLQPTDRCGIGHSLHLRAFW